MPIFHPSDIDVNVVKNHSSAEAKILNYLSKMPQNTSNWHIYYSYSFKQRSSKNKIHNFNELDFLILAPNVGIFVLEVKGGNIKVNHDKLYSIDRYNSSYQIDPYNQGLNNYYGLKDLILETDNKLKIDSFIGGTLVAFPDISTKPNIGFRSDNVDTFVYGMDLYKFIINNSNHLVSRDHLMLPSQEIINKLVNILSGPNFVYNLSLKDYIESVNLSINELSMEQLTIFRGLLDNKRCLIKGQEGTGKTILGEFLFRELTLNRKERVIYFTFNRMVANRIKNDLKLHSSCCYSIIDYLEEEYVSLIGEIPSNIKGFKKKTEFLFDNCLNILSKEDITPFDYVIFDEANLIKSSDKMLFFLNSYLKDGIKNSGCYLFFDNDVDNNDLYNDNIFDEYRYTKFSLIKNCRNSSVVQELIDEVRFGLDTLKDTGNKYYEEISNASKVIKQIDNLINNGINNKQITILFNQSTKRKNNQILKELINYYQDNIIRYNKLNNDNKISYANVNSFGGLENDIIIYINDDNVKPLEHVKAVSRAKVLCYIDKVLLS